VRTFYIYGRQCGCFNLYFPSLRYVTKLLQLYDTAIFKMRYSAPHYLMPSATEADEKSIIDSNLNDWM